MKSYGGKLFESIVEKDNFIVAQKLSRQGKSNRKEIKIFEANLDKNPAACYSQKVSYGKIQKQEDI